MKHYTEELKIRKTMMHKRGAEMQKALKDVTGPLPVPIFANFNEDLGKWEFFADSVSKENAIGILEAGPEDLLEGLNDDGVTYQIRLTGCVKTIFTAQLDVEVKEMIQAEKPEDSKTFEELKDAILNNGVMTEEELKERLAWAKSHRLPEEAIRQVSERFWTKKPHKPAKKPKTLYIDPDPKSKSASIVGLAVLAVLTGQGGLLFEGDKSVGKNVCAESLAWFFNLPYYMITFTRGMTGDDIFGTKATDNSASALLSEDLAAAYLYVQHFPDASKELVDKAAKYEYLKAKSASVSIVQEQSCFVEWLKNGGLMSFNEMNLAEANFFASFTNQITDNTGFIDISGHGRIEINPDCVLIGTQNANYTGVCEQNEATMSRFGCIQFPYPKSIRPQLEATVGKKRLDREYFKQADTLYQLFLASTRKGMVENSCLNIRGFIRALSGVAQIPGLSTLAEQIRIHVIDTCPIDDRVNLMQQVRETITL